MDRRIQSCFVVLFCAFIIVWCMLSGNDTQLNTRIIDWSFTSMLGAVGIFHLARGINEAMDTVIAAKAATELANASSTPSSVVNVNIPPGV